MRNAEINFDRAASGCSPSRLAAAGGLRRREGELRRAPRPRWTRRRRRCARPRRTSRYTKIFSPIDGVVVDRQYDIGQTVAASFQAPTLFTIAAGPDEDAGAGGRRPVRHRPGRRSARWRASPWTPIPRRISRRDLADPAERHGRTRTSSPIPVIIEVPNPEEKLRPKMTANVTIEVARVEDVLRVPNAALRFRPTGAGRPGERVPAGGARGAAAASARPGRSGRAGATPAGQLDRAATGGGRRPEGAGRLRRSTPAGELKRGRDAHGNHRRPLHRGRRRRARNPATRSSSGS